LLVLLFVLLLVSFIVRLLYYLLVLLFVSFIDIRCSFIVLIILMSNVLKVRSIS
jgi:hypothetical protein